MGTVSALTWEPTLSLIVGREVEATVANGGGGENVGVGTGGSFLGGGASAIGTGCDLSAASSVLLIMVHSAYNSQTR